MGKFEFFSFMLSIPIQTTQIVFDALVDYPATTICNNSALLASLKSQVDDRIGRSAKFRVYCALVDVDISILSISEFLDKGGIYHLFMLDGDELVESSEFINFIQEKSPQFTSLQSQISVLQISLQTQIQNLQISNANQATQTQNLQTQFNEFKNKMRIVACDVLGALASS